MAILLSLSIRHLLTDTNQSVVSGVYLILTDSYRLDLGKPGLITLAFQPTALLLQRAVGFTDTRLIGPFHVPAQTALLPDTEREP